MQVVNLIDFVKVFNCETVNFEDVYEFDMTNYFEYDSDYESNFYLDIDSVSVSEFDFDYDSDFVIYYDDFGIDFDSDTDIYSE